MTLYTNTLSSIFDHYADVIEGGNAYNSGTAFPGIPGRHSLSKFEGETLTIDTPGTGQEDTAATVDSLPAGMQRSQSPFPTISDEFSTWHAECATATNSGNVGATRRFIVPGGPVAFPKITLQAALPADMTADDTFTIRQGFKRAPDRLDIMSDEQDVPNGFDRMFHLSALPGRRMAWYGNGIETYETTLQLRLRFRKESRLRNWTAAAMDSLLRIRVELTEPDRRDGTYVHMLDAIDSEPEIEVDDEHKIIVLDTFRMIYRINSQIL